MTKRKNEQIQRRASPEALAARIERPRDTIDWRLLLIGGVLLLGVVILVIYMLFASGSSGPLGIPQPDDGGEHVPSCEPGDYSSTPATSGCHLDTPAEWGVYSAPQDEVRLIHNLEHGGIVIWYQPDVLEDSQVDQLRNLVGAMTGPRATHYKVILSPWDGPDFERPIAVTAWRQLMYLDEADTGAINDFIADHYLKAPEPNGGPGPPLDPFHGSD